MFKNYFINLGKILKNTFIFGKNTFKSHTLKIWLLIIFQVILAIPLLYFVKEIGFMNFSTAYKILSIVAFGVFLAIFFAMFKKVFNFASFGLEKENISNQRIIKSLLILGLLNCIPFLMLITLFSLAQIIPALGAYLKIFLNIFTFLFYFAMSLSIASIVLYRNKNVFISILKGLKIFFKKILLTLPIFALIFLLAAIISYLSSTLLYAIFIYFNYLNENLVNSIHAIMNVYSLYVICGLYIGSQVAFLKGENE